MQKLYSVYQVGEKFNVTHITIHNWIKKYNVSYIVGPGNQFLLNDKSMSEIKQIILKKYNLLEEEV